MNISPKSVTKFNEREDNDWNEIISDTIRSLSGKGCEVCVDCDQQYIAFNEHNCLKTLKSELSLQKQYFQRVIVKIRDLWSDETLSLRNQLKAFERTNKFLKTKLIKQKILSENRIKLLVKRKKQLISGLKMNDRINERVINESKDVNKIGCHEMGANAEDNSSDSIEVIHESINCINTQNNVTNFWRPFETSAAPDDKDTNHVGTQQIPTLVPNYTFHMNFQQYLASNPDLFVSQQMVSTSTIPQHLCGNTLIDTKLRGQSQDDSSRGQASNENMKSAAKKRKVYRKREKLEQNIQLNCDWKGCQKVFKFRSALENHRLVHSDEKRFSCPVCGQRYKQHSGLYLHQASKHGDNKPFVCGFCGTGFVDMRNMKIHEYNQHTSAESAGADQYDADEHRKRVHLQLRLASNDSQSQ